MAGTLNGTFASARTIIFIDPRIPDLQALIDGAQSGDMVFVLDAATDGVQQIADILSANNFSDLAAIHIVSHGSAGEVQLGSTFLNDSTLAEHSTALAQIGSFLAAGGDLLLYGCDVAAGDAGKQFIADLSSYTAADVSAATHVVGSADLGGNWTLDASTGPIEASAPFTADALTNFSSVLAGTIDGQLWYSIMDIPGPAPGAPPGTPARKVGGFFNSDGTSFTPAGGTLSGTSTPPVTGSTIAVDTAAGLMFVGNSDHLTVTVYNFNTNALIETIQVGNPNAGGTLDDDLVYALAVDPINHVLFVNRFDGTSTGIVKISYDPLTGDLNNNGAYNSGSQQFLITNAGTTAAYDGVHGYTFGTAFEVDITTHKLYYTDYDSNFTGSFGGANFVGTNEIVVVSDYTAASPTVTRLTTAAQFPANGSNGYIGNMAIDDAKGLIYFTVSNLSLSNGQAELYYMPIAGGTATKISDIDNVNIGDVITAGLSLDAQSQQLYVSLAYFDPGGPGSGIDPSANANHVLKYQISADGHSLSLLSSYTLAQLEGQTPTDENSHPGASFFNQLPTLTLTGTSSHIAEQSFNTTFLDLTASNTSSDTDGAYYSNATVQITGGTFTANETSANDDHLSVNDGGAHKTSGTFTGTNITISFNSATEKLTLSGYDTIAHYNTVLAAVEYSTSGDNPTDYGLQNTRTVTWTVSDGSLNVPTGNQNSGTSTFTIDAQNDAPNVNVGGADSASIAVNETNSGINQSRSLTITDPDSLTETLTLTGFTKSGPTGGISDATLQGFFSVPATVNIVQNSGSASFNWTFNSGAEAFNYLPAGVTLTLGRTIHDVDSNDSNGPGSASLSDDQAISVVITGVNDAPVVTAGNTLPYTENDAATTISPSATITDVDSADFNSGSLTVGFTANGTAADQLTIQNQGAGAGQIGLSGSNVTYGGLTIGTFFGGANGANLVVNFTTTDATQAAVQALLDHIQYANNSDNPSTLARTVTYTLNDGDGTANGGTNTGTATATINVTAVNDPPVNNKPGAQSVNEDAALVFNAGNGNPISITDPDAQSGNETVTLSVNHGTLTLGSVAGLAFDSGANGAAAMTFHGTLANVNTALNGLSYSATPNYNGGDTLSITTNDNSNSPTSPSNPLQDADTVAISVTAVNDAPTVINGASVAFAAINEDAASPPGETINQLLSTHFSDALDDQLANGGSAPNNFAGILVTANAATAGEGVWKYSTDGGSNWFAIADVSGADDFLIAATDLIRFEPASDFNGTPGSLTVHLVDDSSGAITTGTIANVAAFGGTTRYSSATVTIGETVNAVNDAPTFTALGGVPHAAFTEGGAAVVLDADAVAHDVELDALNGGSGNYAGATLTLARHGGASAQDVFGDSGTLTLSGGNVQIVATTVGTFTNSGGTLAITFNSNATTTLVGNVLDQITYLNSSDAPPASVQIDYTLNDGNAGSQGSGGALAAIGNVIVDITAANDAPDVTPNAPGAVSYQLTGSAVGLLSSGAVTDADQPANFAGGDLTVQITANSTAGDAISLLASSGFNVTGSGPFTLNDGATAIGTISGLGTDTVSVTALTSDATPTEISKLVEAFGFTATGAAGTDRSITFTFHDGGNVGDVAPGAVDATPPVQVVHVTAAPVATDPTISVTGTATHAVEQTGRITLADTVSITTNATQDATDTIHTATVTISGSFVGSGDELSVLDAGGTTHVTSGALVDFPNISVSVATDGSGNITLTLTGTGAVPPGTDTRANFEAALAKVQFFANGDNPTDYDIHNGRTLTWSVNDGTTSSLPDLTNITVDPVDDAPTNTVPGATQSVNEDTALTFTSGGGNAISVSDPDNQSLTVTLSTTHGNVTLGSVTNLTVSGNGSHTVTISGLTGDLNSALATLSYQGDANFHGADTLTVSSDDGTAPATQDIVNITVDSVDDAPAGTDNAPSTPLNTPLIFNAGDFGFTDPNDGPPHGTANSFTAVTITNITLPAGATLKDGATTVTNGASIPIADINAGNLVFTPASGAGGANYAHFTFAVQDDGVGANLDPTPNLMTLNVGSGFGPSPVADNYAVVESATDHENAPGVLGNDAGSNLTVTAVNGSGGNVGNSTAGTYGHLTLNTDGSLDYAADTTAAIDAAPNGTHPVDTFNYTATDDEAPPLSATTTVSFTIDRPPTLITHNVDIPRGASVGPVSANDTDPDGDSFTVTAVTGGAVGSPLAGTYGTVTINSNDTFSYSANNLAVIDGVTGSHPIDTFTYTVDDGLGGTTLETLSFSVNRLPNSSVDNDPANDGGSFNGVITEGAAADTTVGITALASDLDADTISYSLTSSAGGFFKIDASTGVVSVTSTGATGIDFESAPAHVYSITVQANDGHGGTSTQSFTIAVDDVAPSAPADSDTGTANSVAEGAAANTYVGLTASSTDVNGGTIVYSLTDNAGGAFKIDGSTGQVSVNNAAAIDYESASGHALSITVQAATTNGLLVSTQDFSIAITNANPSTPTDADGTANSVTEGAAANTLVHVTASSTDPNGPAVTYSITSDPSGGGFKIDSSTGVVSVADDTKINYETAPGHAYSITVQASDGAGGTSSQSFSIAVTDVAPVATDDTYDGANSADEDQPLNIAAADGVLANDTDVNGGPLTAVLDVGPLHAASFTLHPDGSFDYTPAANYNGSDSFTYHAFDGSQSSSVVTASITINAVNDAPVLTGFGDTPSFTENGSSVILDTNGNASVSDVELDASPNKYEGATLTIARSGGPNTEDAFSTTNAVDLIDSNGFGENVSLDGGVTFIGTWSQPGDGSFIFTFNANASAADINTVMRNIIYADVSENPPTSAQIAFTLSDGNGVPGGQAQGGGPTPGIGVGNITVAITQVDDAPVLIDVAPGAAYVIGNPGVVLSSGLQVFDIDATPPSTLQGIHTATVSISSGFFAGDQLFVNLPTSGGFFIVDDGSGPVVTNISVTSNAAGTMVLGGTDTTLRYQLVLDAVNYRSTAADPTNGGTDPNRTITWQVNDGALNSQTPNPDPNNLVNATILHFDVAPTVDLDASGAGTGFTTTFTENGAPIAIADTDASIVDPDTAALDSMTFVLTNATAGDSLSVAGTLPSGIDSSIDTSVAGQITLQLFNSASLADYQTALSQIRFVNSSDNPNTTDRDITVVAHESGGIDSNVAHATVHVIAVNDAPVLAGVPATASFRIHGAPVTLAAALSVSDLDNTTLASATVHVSAGTFVGDGDVLAVSAGGLSGTGISASYNAASETLTLSGVDTLAHYQQALDHVTFESTSANATNGGLNPTRTVEWQVNDGSAAHNLSTIATETINIVNPPLFDFNGDGKGDILWQNGDGTPAVWLMNGTGIASTGPALPNPNAGLSVGAPTWKEIDAGDFNGDGKADILWQNENGTPAVWLMNGTGVDTFGPALANPGPAWHAKEAADFNGDGKADILWQNDNGTPAVWLMNGVNVLSTGPALANPGPTWHVGDAADFNGDGKADILWQNDNGTPAVWLMDGVNVLSTGPALANPGPTWHEIAAGDFNGDGKADILWQNNDGTPAVWLMDGTTVLSTGPALANPGTAWHAKEAEDFNGDGKADILWQHNDGTPAVWLMNGTAVTSFGPALVDPGAAWHII